MNLKFNRNIFKNKNIYTYFFFLIIFFIGIKIFKDFGLFGDEPIHQWIGSIYYSHIKELILNFNYNNEYIAEIKRLSNHDNFKVWIVYPIFFDLLTQFLTDILTKIFSYMQKPTTSSL